MSEDDTTISLGFFDLEVAIGAGAMGMVWRGWHRDQQLAAAIKVLAPDLAADPFCRQALRDEVRAVAALDHQRIIGIYDQGQVSADAEAASAGQLRSGSPYLVMAYAPGGALRGVPLPLSFDQVGPLLLALLDGLAHAHARGVIHRDIKPENILLLSPERRLDSLVLSDFGLAHLAHHRTRQNSREEPTGTPLYMAPEQFAGRWRDYGPPTDLYALGCVAYELLCGHAPYGGDALHGLATAHTRAPIPRLSTGTSVPERLDVWLTGLLAKSPHDRFATAADASRALLGLSGSSAEASLPLRDWAEGGAAAGTPAPMGVGLGLYGVRRIPFVGRVAQRQRVFEALERAANTGEPQLVLVHGPAGIGKSRLARWAGQRALELGSAHLVWARHSPVANAGDGLPHLLARHFSCLGSTRSEAQSRVRDWWSRHAPVDEADVASLTELMERPDTQAHSASTRPRRRLTAAERYAVLTRWLRRLSRDRPVIAWLDDVQWGPDALGLVAHVLSGSHAGALPVLFLLTVRVERPRDLSTVPGLDDLLRARSQSIAVDRLSRDEQNELVANLLGLRQPLADQICDRAAGNPLFAVQLVGDWVDRGLLEPTAGGFALSAGARVSIPDDLHGLWMERVAHVTRGLDDAALALSIAAALGREVSMDEWHRACRISGAAIDPLLGRLLDTGLSRRTHTGWRFEHPLLHESVTRQSRELGDWQAANLACSTALRPAWVRGDAGAAERIGRHLDEAGQTAEALEPLLRGAQELEQRSGFDEALALLERRDAGLRRLAVAAEDDRWGHGWVVRARILATRGHMEASLEWARRAERTARRYRWDDLLPLALDAIGSVHLWLGSPEEAADIYANALNLLGDSTAPARARCLLGLAEVAGLRGALSDARAHCTEALALNVDSDEALGAAYCELYLARIAFWRKELDVAGPAFAAVLKRLERLGDRQGQADAEFGLGDVARLRRELDLANTHYERSARLCEDGSPLHVLATLSLALVLLARNRFSQARPLLEAGQDAFARMGQGGYLGAVQLGLMTCAAAAGDWSMFESHCRSARRLLSEAAYTEPDLAAVASQAATLAREQGATASAHRAAQLASELQGRID